MTTRQQALANLGDATISDVFEASAGELGGILRDAARWREFESRCVRVENFEGSYKLTLRLPVGEGTFRQALDAAIIAGSDRKNGESK